MPPSAKAAAISRAVEDEPGRDHERSGAALARRPDEGGGTSPDRLDLVVARVGLRAPQPSSTVTGVPGSLRSTSDWPTLPVKPWRLSHTASRSAGTGAPPIDSGRPEPFRTVVANEHGNTHRRQASLQS